MPRSIKAWSVLVLSLLISVPLLAQPNRPVGPDGKPLGRIGAEIEVTWLYPSGKFFEYDSLFPLVLQYKNLTQESQYFILDWDLDSTLPEEYKETKLEPGQTKRIPLIFPPRQVSQLYSLTVNEQSLNTGVQGNSQYHITGLLTADGKNLDYLRALALERNVYYTPGTNNESEEYNVLSSLSELDYEEFPRHWSLLKSLDVIVSYDLNALNLGEQQYLALKRWVADGGVLVVMSNGIPTEYKGTPLADLLPFSPSETVTTEHGLLVNGSVGEAKVWAEHQDYPLMVSKDHGKGKVFFVTTPMVDMTLLGKDVTEKVWRHPFDSIDPNIQNSRYVLPNRTFQESIPELPRTQAGWVALFVILYGLAVGPINLSILRKKDKMLYAFVTVPLVAVLFAGSAYLVNRVIRPSSPVLRDLGWLETQSGSTQALLQGEQVLFSPYSTSFQLSSDNTTMFDLYRNHYRSYRREFSIFQLTPEAGLKSQVKLRTWDVQRFNTLGVQQIEKPLEMKLDLESGSGQITIKSPHQSNGESAFIANSKVGFSDPFQLKSGEHSYSVSLSPMTRPTSVKTFDKEEFPGRNYLMDEVWQRLDKSPEKYYLFFWTESVSSPIRMEPEGVHRTDYLVTVEVTK